MEEILSELRRMVGEVLAIDPAAIQAEKPLIEYGMDSVRAVDFVVSVEERYGVQVGDADVARMRTLADVVEYLRAKRPR